jgi:hypothetical protein
VVSFLKRKPAEPAPVVVETTAADDKPAVGKGRPTPKRRDAQGARRGPVAPPPKTQREAVARSKEAGKNLTKDERKALQAERREKMMRGDPASLLPRDRGEIRSYVRDAVDTRRNLAGILLPVAVLMFVVLLIPNVYILQAYAPIVLLVVILAAVADAVVLGRQLSRRVQAEFPKGDGSGLSAKGGALGFYAFNRACLPRKWRVPRPKVARGGQPLS